MPTPLTDSIPRDLSKPSYKCVLVRCLFGGRDKLRATDGWQLNFVKTQSRPTPLAPTIPFRYGRDSISVCHKRTGQTKREIEQKEAKEHPEDDVIDNDLILVWGKQKRIITGSDILGRLLRGISSQEIKSSWA